MRSLANATEEYILIHYYHTCTFHLTLSCIHTLSVPLRLSVGSVLPHLQKNKPYSIQISHEFVRRNPKSQMGYGLVLQKVSMHYWWHGMLSFPIAIITGTSFLNTFTGWILCLVLMAKGKWIMQCIQWCIGNLCKIQPQRIWYLGVRPTNSVGICDSHVVRYGILAGQCVICWSATDRVKLKGVC